MESHKIPWFQSPPISKKMITRCCTFSRFVQVDLSERPPGRLNGAAPVATKETTGAKRARRERRGRGDELGG